MNGKIFLFKNMCYNALGEDSTPEQRNSVILEKMKNLKVDERKAKVVCVIPYYEKGKFIIAKGEVEGKIAPSVSKDSNLVF